MIKIVPDANLLLSGMFGITGSPSRKIINLALAKKIVLFGSEETYREFCEKIKKPRLSKYWKRQIFSLEKLALDYRLFINMVNTQGVLDGVRIVEPDPTDDIYFRVAKACNSRIIISGDKHVLGVGKYDGIVTTTPKKFLEKFEHLGR